MLYHLHLANHDLIPFSSQFKVENKYKIQLLYTVALLSHSFLICWLTDPATQFFQVVEKKIKIGNFVFFISADPLLSHVGKTNNLQK